MQFEFKVTVHYSLWAKCIQLWPLKLYRLHPASRVTRVIIGLSVRAHKDGTLMDRGMGCNTLEINSHLICSFCQNGALWSVSDGYIKIDRFQRTQDGNLIWAFFWYKGEIANVMLEILDGFSLVWVLMHTHSKSVFVVFNHGFTNWLQICN